MELWELLQQLGISLGKVLAYLFQWAFQWWILLAWLAWWLWGVNWSKTWPVLARGAWAGVVLAMLTTALVWSQLAPSTCTCLGFTTVPNFWWQLGGVSLLVAVTLCCGWLQGLIGWHPADISLEPPESSDHSPAHH